MLKYDIFTFFFIYHPQCVPLPFYCVLLIENVYYIQYLLSYVDNIICRVLEMSNVICIFEKSKLLTVNKCIAMIIVTFQNQEVC